MTKLFSQSAPPPADEDYSRKAMRAAPRTLVGQAGNVLTPAGLSMPRFDTWLDADKQAAMFHSWLMDEDLTWLSLALGLVVDIDGLPMTISLRDAAERTSKFIRCAPP